MLQDKRFRDLDAERAEARRQAFEAQHGTRAVAWPEMASIALCVIGFEARERELLDSLVRLSERRSPRLNLLPRAQAHQADVIMIDGADDEAVAWGEAQNWLGGRAVIWVNKRAENPAHTTLSRPIQWPMLQLVLARTLRVAPTTGRELMTRSIQPDAPMIMVLAGQATVRHQLGSMLQSSGYRVTLMATAREGLAALHAAEYGCVLLAGDLPDSDVLETCRRLRSLERKVGRMPILMLENEVGTLQKLRASMAGCDDVLPRPQRRRDLQQILESRLTLSRRTSAAAA